MSQQVTQRLWLRLNPAEQEERKYRGYHHDTYNFARIYALGGKSQEALKWLRTTAAEGLPNYPLYRFLDRIRDDPG